MRKVIILCLFMLSLTGCFKNEINSSIYISSIGFEIKEDKIVCYFLSNPLNNISRNTSGSEDSDSEFIKIEANSIDGAFKEAEKTLLLPLNYRHIKSIIFNKDVFNTKYIEEFFRFMRSGVYVTYNYYVFATEDKIEDILKFKNPEQLSHQNSILSSPNLIEFEKYGLKQMHFLDFANAYFEKGRYLHIPLISVKKVWNKNDTLEVSGYLASQNELNVFKNEDYLGITYLKDQEMIIFYTEEASYRIIGYKVSFKVIDNIYTIVIKYDDLYIFGNGTKDELNLKLRNEIKKYLDDYIAKYNNLYLISEYNYLNKKALDVLLYDIKVINKK